MTSAAPFVTVTGPPVEGSEKLSTPEALRFLGSLHRQFAALALTCFAAEPNDGKSSG